MANYFYTDLGADDSISLTMSGINIGDSNLYLRCAPVGTIKLPPGSKVKAIVLPSGSTTLSNPTAPYSVDGIIERLRSNVSISNDSLGIYTVGGGENNSSSPVELSFNDIKINNYNWENTPYNLHWIFQREDRESYGSSSGIWTLPHNIQNKEILISGLLVDSGDYMRYTLHWNSITNSNSPLYTSDGPYRVFVNYVWDSGVLVEGFNDWVYYSSGTMDSGIIFDLPFNDPRNGSPAIYDFNLTNISADSNLRPGSSNKIVRIDHQTFLDSENYFRNLDEQVFNSPDPLKLKKINEIKIEPGIINRKRLSIGINDISIKNNTYVKQGVYVSQFYPLDFNIYTFSLKVDEFIPEYLNLNPYDIVQYYAEFNSKWERISPITRGDELNDNILVPKLFVFDKGTSVNNLKYLELGNVKGFRIKISLDLSKLTDNNFISPEIYDYKCIIYSKNQFLNL